MVPAVSGSMLSPACSDGLGTLQNRMDRFDSIGTAYFPVLIRWES